MERFGNRIGREAFLGAVLLLFSLGAVAAGPALRVVSASPAGETAKLEECREIRILFSEPMVDLGRIPDEVKAPFVTIAPPLKGQFRWSGTRLLVFTPDPASPLPFCTQYKVDVATTAVSASGHALESPYGFTFKTPTVRLLSAGWYRLGGRYDAPAVLGLRFNQPVSAQAVAAHAHLKYTAHEWKPPEIQREVMERLARENPQAFVAFQKKVARTLAAANAAGAVPFKLAADWDKKRFEPGTGLVVLETTSVPPPQADVLLELDGALPGLGGQATPGTPQTYEFLMEPALFLTGLRCAKDCSVEFYNALEFSRPVRAQAVRPLLVASDVTDPGKPVVLTLEKAVSQKKGAEDEEGGEGDTAESGTALSLDALGLKLKPARTYLFTVKGDLRSEDGQTLGYDWVGQAIYWHKSALTSFGAGHGVWESSGGPQLPFSARNYRAVDQWLASLDRDHLVAAVLRVDGWTLNKEGVPERSETRKRLPDGDPRRRSLQILPDATGTFGLDLAPALNAEGKGLVWAGLAGKDKLTPCYDASPAPSATLLQVTNLGLSVKDSPVNTLVMVTALDTGAPVESAEVEIRTLDNKVFWTGKTDRNGIAVAPDTDLRTRLKTDPWDWTWVPAFVVTAKKGGDTAYVVSDWNEGVRSWDFDLPFNLEEAKPVLRGSAFPDRGVYKLGEEVHVKAILRSDTAKGMKLLPEGTRVHAVLKDSRDREVDRRDLKLNGWSAADWPVKLPQDGALGTYTLSLELPGHHRSVTRSFLAAAYRKPDFRVDATVGGPDDIAGATLKGTVTGRYLFGSPMAGRPVKLTYFKEAINEVPKAVTDAFPSERFAFLSEAWRVEDRGPEGEQLFQRDAFLDKDGAVAVDLPTDPKAGRPYAYTLEGEVTDLSRQTIAGRASFPVHPAPWYLGLKRPGFFVEQKDGVKTEVVAVTPRGEVGAGVRATIRLLQVQWVSARSAEGEGMYAWESRREERERWSADVTTGREPVAVQVPLAAGGYYILEVRATDAEGRTTLTDTDFYSLGTGYTAWQRFDHNRMDLVPEKKTYKPGETARVMIQSPWERATALLTVEREGIRTHREFVLTSTQETVSVPITEADLPNVFVSVLLVRGRTSKEVGKDGADPGKPAFRLGYCQIKVDDGGKRLSAAVTTDREEYRPLDTATVSVEVRDTAGKPAQAEVTLWAVDYGVLSLTGYKTPDVLDSVWVPKALQVMNEDSRQNIVSRRVITPKGADEGGGGGLDEGAENKARKDFRVLAFWMGSAVTDASGRVTTQQKLPEAMTTYRVMAVVQDKAHRFGWGQREIRLSKPVLLTAAFPRFLALGDRATFGAVVHSLLKEPGTALVTMKSLTPEVLEVAGGTLNVQVPAQGAAEARFDVSAVKSTGTGRLLMSVRMNGEEDAFELPLSVCVIAPPEVVAAYGIADPQSQEGVALPQGVLPSVGGLHLELSSTALVGLGEGARYLVEYPYGCAEQRASCALALMLAADLGGAFQLQGIKAEDLKSVTQKTLRELEEFQCDNGGFVYWKGDSCAYASPYLTSWVLHVMQRGKALGYDVTPDVLTKGCDYLEQALNGREAPPNESFLPAYTSWQAFAVKVLAEEGRTVDSALTRLYGYRDRMPVFALCYLRDAMSAAGEKGARPDEIARRLTNAILPEAGTAHVEEIADPYLLWYWNSAVRSTALALGTLSRTRESESLVPGMVRWLLAARKDGRWGNTQENAAAMEALVSYYRAFEGEVPDFNAVVALGAKTLMTETFKGREAKARFQDTPMRDLLQAGQPGERLPLAFKKEGTGKLFYVARLKYASDLMVLRAMDSGITVRRRYEPAAGGPAATRFKAGDLVRVVLEFDLTKERRWVAVADPIPAGFEPVESWFATTARDLSAEQENNEEGGEWVDWWERGGFDHVERHDDRVLLFATRLSEGRHSFNYVCRATTSGTFTVAPARAEEMYEPEVFGRTATTAVEVSP